MGSALGGGPAVARQYHVALEDSIKRHFPSNDCINCMCHSTENFYRQARAAAPASDVLAQNLQPLPAGAGLGASLASCLLHLPHWVQTQRACMNCNVLMFLI